MLSELRGKVWITFKHESLVCRVDGYKLMRQHTRKINVITLSFIGINLQ